VSVPRIARNAVALTCLASLAVISAPIPRAAEKTNPCGPDLFVPAPPSHEAVRAAFAARSYSAGSVASLSVFARSRGPARLQVFRAGIGDVRAPHGLRLTPVSAARRIAVYRGAHWLPVAVRNWASGLYIARIVLGHHVAYAPFVIRPKSSSTNRVAVVVPTNTWAAYNFRDSDGNGYGDTWYADPRVHTVVLARAFLDDGLPQHLARGGFIAWLAQQRQRADFYSDEDLDAIAGGDELARRYDLIVFSGHEEYVTQHMFSVIERYRDLGGNLAFLSANNLYSRVTITRGRMTCLGHFRDFGEPEARLVGVQYRDWSHNAYPNQPYVTRDMAAAPWLFRGTDLRIGERFGYHYGIEIDALAASSPGGIHVLADLPAIFGPGETGQMTFYETPSGAKVFAAGAMNFDYPQSAVTERMLENLWTYLREP
jgi:hypothetical protein